MDIPRPNRRKAAYRVNPFVQAPSGRRVSQPARLRTRRKQADVRGKKRLCKGNCLSYDAHRDHFSRLILSTNASPTPTINEIDNERFCTHFGTSQ